MAHSGHERKRRVSKQDDFSDDDNDFAPASAPYASNEVCREEIRDELRDGYRRLKDALPVSNQKSSKVSLGPCHYPHQILGDDPTAA
ncbi:hypothetical protein BGY98DRAFT_1104438 [Russula aff. rugulosa BPL654]|nr:hypothetical protein BGY98DRAFT_1104438 [Russula aff. rugulosa BPL654]